MDLNSGLFIKLYFPNYRWFIPVVSFGCKNTEKCVMLVTKHISGKGVVLPKPIAYLCQERFSQARFGKYISWFEGITYWRQRSFLLFFRPLFRLPFTHRSSKLLLLLPVCFLPQHHVVVLMGSHSALFREWFFVLYLTTLFRKLKIMGILAYNNISPVGMDTIIYQGYKIRQHHRLQCFVMRCPYGIRHAAIDWKE